MRQAAGGGPAIDAWLLREWYASARTPPRRLFLRSSELPRWMRGIFYVVLPSIVLFAVALLTVPVTERFSFSEGNGICQASHVEAFATGDQVAFSWATHPWTWRGATPVQLDLIAPGGSPQFSYLLFNGSFAFDAVAGGYTFLANGCAQGSVDVQGTSRGPVV